MSVDLTDDFNRLMRESAHFAGGFQKLSQIRDEDVRIAETPKDEVFRSGKTVLYHYRPLPGSPVETGPVLIVYSLIGRYTVIDLQEDRSLVRNLMTHGCDPYVIDWGTPLGPATATNTVPGGCPSCGSGPSAPVMPTP